MNTTKPLAHGVRGNRLTTASDDEVDYELQDPAGLFSTHGNAVPMMSAVQQPRMLYASKFFEQAQPLVGREAPLVRNLNETEGMSWDRLLGKHMGARHAPADGQVIKVTPDEITLRDAEGKTHVVELYNQFPGNRKSLLHNTPKVEKGTQVQAGQLLATSNYTDDEGRMAMGRNARIAVVPFKGETIDDAVVVSASFAEKLKSEHAESIDHDFDDSLQGGKNHFRALFAKKFSEDQYDKLDDEGVVRPGQILQKGDPVMLFTRPTSFSSQGPDAGRLSRARRFVRKDASKVWDGDDPAEVLAVGKARDGGMRVLVRYEAPARAGDKIVLRAGGKGIITRIIPDEKMPRTEDGEPIELLLNQLSLPSRENASSFFELLLGKVAKKTGKPFVLPPHPPKGQTWLKIVERALEEAGVEEAERLYDPDEGKFLDEPVTVGYGHILRLHHLAGDKLTQRGQAGYDLNMQPLKGGESSAQRVSGLEMNVLLSSGGYGTQQESVLLKGEKRDDYWKQLRMNRQPATLDKPFVWEKFRALLAGAGINTKDMGHGRLRLAPMTDKELEARGSLEIENDGIVDLSDYEPKPGGLFDPRLVRENRWGHVTLSEPVLNPSYEETVRILLGLTKAELEELLDREDESP